MGVDPFVGTEALAAGVVNRYQLATRYDAVYRNVYVPRRSTADTRAEGEGGLVVVGATGDGGGLSAAALHGSLWIDRVCLRS